MTRGFTSVFADDLNNMIDMRVALGYSETTYLDRAQSFDRYCAENYSDAVSLTEPMVLGWMMPDINTDANSVHRKAAFARAFGRYLQSIGKPAYVIHDKFTAGKRTFIPYLFSDNEMTSVFHQIDLYKNSGKPFEPILLSTYFRMTYTCGLRPNEGRNLKRCDVDLSIGEIKIADTKWHKSRIIVMSDEMAALARSYAVLRDAAFPDSDYFFPKEDGSTYTAAWMQNKLRRFFALANPEIPKELLPSIRVYDLRHRFATAVLNRWLDNKLDLSSRLPYLQTYMGHNDMASTAYYIHLLPENLVKSAGIDWESMNSIIPEVELWGE